MGRAARRAGFRYPMDWSFLPMAVVFLIPLYLLVVISFKTTAEAYLTPLSLPSDPNWDSYLQALAGEGSRTRGMARALLNSAVITVGSVITLIGLGSVAAYVLGRHQSKVSTAVYLIFVLAIVIPYQLGIVPLYVFIRSLGLVNTHLGAILLYTGVFMPLTVFLYTGYVRTLPRDYEEAARVDGASPSRVFVKVVLPLLLPITGTVAVLVSLLVFNDFFLQLVFLTRPEMVTVPVAIHSLAAAEVTQWNKVFAAVAIAILPLLAFFVFAQRNLIRGFTGGIRG